MQIFDDSIREEFEGFEISERIELYTLDTSKIGGGIYHFTPVPVTDAQGDSIEPSFEGQTYAVVPMESKGWEFSAGGQLPRPELTFKIAREDGDVLSAAATLMSIVEAMDDLVGARVYRLQTMRRFLDDGTTPDPSAHLGIEVFEVEQKPGQGRGEIRFLLTSGLDLEGVRLPRRQALNRCSWSYRTYANGSFQYADAICPYAGSAMYDINGDPVTNPQEDRCGKLLKDCKLRFGANAELPFGGFPGSGRIGVR